MGTKLNPGTYDCYANAAPDEPMFVLLARDDRAPALVEQWATVSEARGTDPAKVAEARQCASAMREYRLGVLGLPAPPSPTPTQFDALRALAEKWKTDADGVAERMRADGRPVNHVPPTLHKCALELLAIIGRI